MRTVIPKIKEFPDDGRRWRLDWIGNVKLNPSIPSEPHLEASIVPLRDGIGDKYDSTSSSINSERQEIYLGVGQLPVLMTGSLWQHGRCLPERAGKEVEFNGLTIDSSTTQIVPAHKIDEGQPLVPRQYYMMGKGYSNPLLAIKWKDDPFGILVPMAELLRYYYATSTDLALALFAGAFRHELHEIINPNHSGLVVAEKRCVLHLRQHICNDDGWVIGRILNSPEAFRGATMLHDQLMKDSLNHKTSHIETCFPFSGDTNLRAYTKLINSQGKWRHLVLTLSHCTGAFPFDELTVFRDNDNRLPPDPSKDLPIEKKLPAFPRPQVKDGDTLDVPLQSQHEINQQFDPVHITLPSDRFGALNGKQIDYPNQKTECRYTGKLRPYLVNAAVDNFGTGQGQYNGTASAKAKLAHKQERRKGLPASFEHFIAAIELINNSPDWKAKIRIYDDLIRYIPLLKNKDQYQWAYLNSPSKKRRHVIIGDIKYNNNIYTVIEFEHRKNEHYKTIILTSDDGIEINNSQIYSVLINIAKNEGILSHFKNQKNIIKATLKHTWNTIESFSFSIKEKIVSTKKLKPQN